MTLRLAIDRQVDAEALREAAEFRVDVARERDAVRVSPVGEIDIATIGEVRAPLDEAMATGTARVILDLRESTFLDTSALHLAVDVHDRTLRDGIGFAIIAGPPAVQRAFEVTGLSARLPFVDVPRA